MPIGKDLSVAPAIRAAMEYARDFDKVAMSSSTEILPTRHHGSTIFICMPFYRQGSKSSMVSDRRNDVVAWVGAFLDLHSLVEGSIDQDAEPIGITVIDGIEDSSGNTLYHQALATGGGRQKPAALSRSVRLKTLFDKAMLLSAFRMGDRDMVMEPVDLFDLLQRCVDGARAHAASRRVQIRTEGTGRTMGDPRYLRIVIDALIDNAVRFSSEEGHVQVSVSEDRDGCWLRVVDRGSGIDTDAIPHLFDELNPGDIMHHTQGHKLSLAIGRAIGRAIVRCHGGDIEVTSSPGAGTRFSVRLPRPSAEVRPGP